MYRNEKLHNLEYLHAVYLLLGPACNMSCRHCTQTPIKSTLNLPPCGGKLSDDVVKFLRQWNKVRNFGRIYFWGGEPLLYWETIKNLILKFNSLGFLRQYVIFTNGLLLDDNIADFCNEHNVWVTMSHDAPNCTAVRNAIPSQKNINAFLRIRRRNVNAVFNAINSDMVATLEFLKKKFPGTPLTLGFINVLSDIPKDIWEFKKGQVEKAVKDLAKYSVDIFDPFGEREAWFRTKLSRLQGWNKARFLEYPFPPCRPGLVSLSINFKGDVIRCHNDDKILGHIREGVNALQDKHLEEWRRLLPPNCKDCKHLSICRNICPIALLKEDKSELIYCDYLRDFWAAIEDCQGEYEIMKANLREYRQIRR